MIKLTAGPSKEKKKGLARATLAVLCILMPSALATAGSVSISSGEESDTVIQVGPGVAPDATPGIRIESDPDNGSSMRSVPRPAPEQTGPELGPIIVTPEFRVRPK